MPVIGSLENKPSTRESYRIPPGQGGRTAGPRLHLNAGRDTISIQRMKLSGIYNNRGRGRHCAFIHRINSILVRTASSVLRNGRFEILVSQSLSNDFAAIAGVNRQTSKRISSHS